MALGDMAMRFAGVRAWFWRTGRVCPVDGRRNRVSALVGVLSWGYLAFTLGLAALLWLVGDLWWPATLLTFGPRWISLLPLPLLVPPAVLFRPTGLAPLVLGGAVSIGPVMGICIAWPHSGAAEPDALGAPIRFLTCNVGGGADIEELLDYVLAEDPDVITLMESGRDLPLPREGDGDWQVRRVGGIFVASRYAIVATETLRSEQLASWHHPALRCTLRTPQGDVEVTAVHLATPREGLEAVLHSLWRGIPEMKRITALRWTESELASELAKSTGPSLVAGDFNMPVDSAIYRRYWSGWQNALSLAGFGFCQTKFTGHFGARIDHILANDDWQVMSARVGPHIGGDHRPVVAELRRR
jgi:endonuclease/exonuclease/phosphatase (EEP) superfamily protein YafD